MPIFMDGKVYEDTAHLEAAFSPMLKDMGVDVKPLPPDVNADPKMVVTPEQADTNKQLEKQDEAVLGGTEVSNRIYVGRTPLGAPTEPAGEFKPDASTQVPDNSQNLQEAFLQRLTGTPNPKPVLDILSQFVGEKYEKIKEALSLPGDAWAGEVDPMSPQGLERANMLAGLMVGGPAPVAAKMADGSLGSFAGVRAKTVSPERMTQFHILEGNMAHPDDIWTKTGMMRGVDKRLRFEIDDSKAGFDKSWFEKAKPVGKDNVPQGPLSQVPFDAYEGMKGTTLSNVLDHPDLYKAYPWLKGVRVIHDPDMKGAHWNGLNNAIVMGPEYSGNKGILMHEVQHAIQDFEGFAPGAAVKDVNNPKAYDLYRRSAGEVEANNVDLRVDLTEASRRRYPPTHTEDIPRSQQIVTEGYGLATEHGMFDQKTGMAVAQKAEPLDPNLPHK